METAGREWTVLTWNLQGTKRTDLDRVAAVIAAEQPDVVALQEVREPQAAALATRLDMTSVWNEKHNPWRPFFPRRAEGAATADAPLAARRRPPTHQRCHARSGAIGGASCSGR